MSVVRNRNERAHNYERSGLGFGAAGDLVSRRAADDGKAVRFDPVLLTAVVNAQGLG
jgi:hypothetical protein